MSKGISIILFCVLINSIVYGQNLNYDIPSMRWSKEYGLKHHSVYDLAVDSKGIIWIGTEEGLYRHHGHEFENINTIVENSPFNNPINTAASSAVKSSGPLLKKRCEATLIPKALSPNGTVLR